jgi:hypothetical protein
MVFSEIDKISFEPELLGLCDTDITGVDTANEACLRLSNHAKIIEIR